MNGGTGIIGLLVIVFICATEPADTLAMDSIDSIAAWSTAMSQAQVQSAVSTKVLKLAQDQQQTTADLLTATLDSVKQSMAAFTGDAGGKLDTVA